MVLDEAHAVKNASAARTIRLNRRAAASYTPFPMFSRRRTQLHACMGKSAGPMMTARCTW